ncbi:hypothetical protein ACSFA0_22585 [Variovorax sp. LT1P1]|uniref:hypothetical protein n=1 Tax=Variovorax sp. LT1P1 TaxID=3443730 RepID=UPI003F46E9BF
MTATPLLRVWSEDRSEKTMRALPAGLRCVEGFPAEMVAFTRSWNTPALLCNLPVQRVPTRLQQACEHSAELAVLAAMHDFGYLLEHMEAAWNQHWLSQVRLAGALFANEYLRPLLNANQRVIFHRAEVRAFFDARSGGPGAVLARAASVPAGQEF